MEKQWFVLHTLTGQENKARDSILARIKAERMEEFIGDCRIPMNSIVEKKNGRRRTIKQKALPGYIFCELALYDETRGEDEDGRKAIYERTWQFLRETPGVIGFIGGDRPMPLKQSEVNDVFGGNAAGEVEPPRPKVNFAINEMVRITDGAFLGMKGQVSMVDPDKGKLKIDVRVFGRNVPVDAEYWQVEKVPEDSEQPEVR